MRKSRRNINILEFRDGRWFENGKRLQKRDYIFHSNCEEGSSILSCVTDQLYRLRGFNGRIIA